MKIRMLPALALGTAVLVVAPSLQGCYGSFAATKKVYKWNGTVGDKWVNSVVMWALNIIPVYSLAGAADIIVLNTVEFWTGSNPLAMAPGESESRIVTVDGRELRVTATRNHLEIAPREGGEALELSFDPATSSWYAATPEGPRLVARQSGETLALYHADGTRELLTR